MDMRLETLIYNSYKSLNENDKYIWNYIFNNKKKCEKMSIQELASSCNVSHTTILRFAQKLGLNGYSELKFYLKLDNNQKSTFNKDEIFNLADDIKRTTEALAQRDFSDVCSLLESSNKIYAYGSGELQKNSIKELKRNLLSVGRLVNVLEGTDELKIVSKYITENDMIFLLSLSGENKRINDFAEGLKNKGVKIVSITQNGSNRLSRLSDINIQFYTHKIASLSENLDIYSLSQFFIVNEFLTLKYLEYKNSK